MITDGLDRKMLYVGYGFLALIGMMGILLTVLTDNLFYMIIIMLMLVVLALAIYKVIVVGSNKELANENIIRSQGMKTTGVVTHVWEDCKHRNGDRYYTYTADIMLADGREITTGVLTEAPREGAKSITYELNGEFITEIEK